MHPVALGFVQAGEGRPAIFGAAGHHHRAGAHRAAVVEAQGVVAGPGAIQSLHHAGDRDVGAELLGLAEGPPGQGVAGDAGGEAQVVLDPHRGPGLAAERPRLQHHHRQSL